MGFSNERMRTGQLVNWFLLDGLELTPAGNPVTKALPLPFGVDHLIGFNELLTAWLQHNGVHAIPAASWSDEDSFRWCFDGISKGGAVAVSTVGCLVHKDAPEGLLDGLKELIRQTEPEELLVYGKTPPAMAALLREHSIPWQAFPHNMAARVRPGEEAQ